MIKQDYQFSETAEDMHAMAAEREDTCESIPLPSPTDIIQAIAVAQLGLFSR